MSGVFDLDQFLDTRRLSGMHLKVIILLVLTMLVDGYDIFSVGFVLPVLAKGLKVEPHALTQAIVLGQAGLLVGATMMGPISDRFGRKTTLLCAMACFSLCCILTAQTKTLGEFTAMRFISSLFFSAVIPNVIALASELAPKGMRATAVSIAFCGYIGGSLLGSLVQAFVLPPFGWQGAFWLGGLLPIVIFFLLLWQLPESLRFRARRNPQDPRIGQVIRQIDPQLKLTGTEYFHVHDILQNSGSVPIQALFTGSLFPVTALLWMTYLLAFIVSHLLTSWNTTILNTLASFSMRNLSVIIGASAVAGIVGTGTSGMIMDRFGHARALTFYFLGEAVALAALGISGGRSPVLILLYMSIDYFNSASVGGLNALAAIVYPSRIRATGVAWASGAGRAGAMLGPIFGGFMLGHHFGMRPIYLCIAVPAVLCSLCMFLMNRRPYVDIE